MRSLDSRRVGQRDCTDAVVVDREPLSPYAVYFLGLVDFNLVYQLVEHPRCELACPRVLSHGRDEHIRGRRLAVDALDVGLKRLYGVAKVSLLILVFFGHTGKALVAYLTGYVVLIELLKERVQLAVAGFGLAQFKLHLFAFCCHCLLSEARHQLGELCLVLAHELRQAAYLAEDNLFEKLHADVMSAGAGATLALCVRAGEIRYLRVSVVEVVVHVASAVCADEQAGEHIALTAVGLAFAYAGAFLLHSLPNFTRYYCLVDVPENSPVFGRVCEPLLVLVRLRVGLKIDEVTAVFLAG